MSIQFFPMPDKTYVIKEVAMVDVVSNMEKMLIAKPPCNTSVFSARHRKTLRYVVDKVHGIPWNVGYMDLEDVEEQVRKTVDEADLIYIKGLDRDKSEKMTFHISINDKSSDIVREYPSGIMFETPYMVGLKSFVTYNSIFNVTSKNNRIVFVIPNDDVPNTKDDADHVDVITLDRTLVKESKHLENESKEFTYDFHTGEEEEEEEENIDTKRKNNNNNIRVTHILDEGIYEVEDILQKIRAKVPKNRLFKIILDTEKQCVKFEGGIGIDFRSSKSIGPLLGFERQMYRADKLHESTLRVDIFPINMIRIRCNLVKSNISDYKFHDDTIHEFPLDSEPGEKIIERPVFPSFYRINTDTLHLLHLKIVDQDNRIVDFRGERVNILLEFRPDK
ncbi:hypothetical protein V9T40_012058 [Parthenolecanium corni]|uniref:Uncharacterized protein n=1 Tax=Parthenolecanium corni TaxID=536013 RepID=A0AAN9TJS7_9HEMI